MSGGRVPGPLSHRAPHQPPQRAYRGADERQNRAWLCDQGTASRAWITFRRVCRSAHYPGEMTKPLCAMEFIKEQAVNGP
jgi:hypothetical protein